MTSKEEILSPDDIEIENNLNELSADDNEIEEAYKRLIIANTGSSSLLVSNCFEFDRPQWEQVVNDRSNKLIATTMASQGATRYETSLDDVASTNQKIIYEKGLLYSHQRATIIEKLEKASDGRKSSKLSEIFPQYIPPEVREIVISVTCQVMKSAPKTKKVTIKREEGLSNAITKAKTAHKGLSLKVEYNLVFVATNEVVTEEDIALLDDGTELRLQEVVAASTASKKSSTATKKSSSTASSVAATPATATTSTNATVVQRRLDNAIRLVCEDVNVMILPISHNVKFHEKFSLMTYMVYWTAHVLNGLNGLLRDMKSNVVPMSRREAIDCLMSLQRCLRDMKASCPIALVHDAENLIRKLSEKVGSMGINLLIAVAEEYPDLIDKTTYDYTTPRSNRLYEEQGMVLDILHEKLTKDEPILIGYRVPPSGGKTILSVALASMISMYHRSARKRLLYVCYNTLVRLSVANACEQASVPFWVATTRAVERTVGSGSSVVATSFSCRDRSRNALRKKRAEAEGAKDGSHKMGELDEVMAKAEDETIHWNPIIIADVTSAYELISKYPERYVVYMDEPTAGAENGFEGNKMQELVGKIIRILPKQAVLLSATLPNLVHELPTLASGRGCTHSASTIIMVETQRLPVGCVAIAPSGKQLLPHEMSANFHEFRYIVSRLKTDALMQRFYTPSQVYKMASTLEKYFEKEYSGNFTDFPSELRFSNVISNIGDISHKDIRSYAVRMLQWVADREESGLGEVLFEKLKGIIHNHDMKVIVSESFVTDHVAQEGRALAVTTSSRIISDVQDETLEELIRKAMSPFIQQIPDVREHIASYLNRKTEYEKQYAAFLRGKEPNLEAAEALEKPQFEWPIHIAGFQATLSDAEIGVLDGETVSHLLSGLGQYDPARMSSFERTVVMREATNGHLACLFSSPDIVYGTNMSLITVFIGSGYGRIATRNSLYQLIGRAGRTGKSHKAKVLFQDLDTMRKAMLPEPEGRNFEAEVIDFHVRKGVEEASN